MKWLINIILILVWSQLNGQNTFSEIYDFDNKANRNYIKDFQLVDNKIITLSTQFCDQDSLHIECGVISKFNLDGTLVQYNIIDSIATFSGGSDCLQYWDNKIYHSVNNLYDNYEFTYLYEYDLELNETKVTPYSGANLYSNIDNEGITIIDSYKYLYGNIKNSGVPDSVQIIKLNMDGTEVWRRYYSYGQAKLDINSLQSTSNGNLSFILEIGSAAGSNNGFDGYQLMKIDTSGEVLDTFKFEDNGQQPNRLLNSNDGNCYFGTLEHPTQGWSPFSYGMINKMNSDLSTLEWSLILPNDQLVDGRHYRMFDYLEASNGDIVACGMAYDNTDTQLSTGIADKNSTWNGFIIRLTPEGEIVWLHLYKNPNDLLPNDEYGRFRPSRLNKIKELPDGRFVAAGDVFVKTSQFAAIDDQETEAFHLWLLMVDDNGCLDGYDCEEIIRLNNESGSDFSIGSKWTYEAWNLPASFVGFQDYNIIDTVVLEGKRAYVIEPGLLESLDYMLVEENKVYFWDMELNAYQLNYDFENDSLYYVHYYNLGQNQVDSIPVFVDSIVTENINNVLHKVQYCKSTLGLGNVLQQFKVISGVGATFRGPRLPVGAVIDNLTNDIQEIRCFENDVLLYMFSEVSCDSTWVTTSVDNIFDKEFSVYPNPTTGEIFIDGIPIDTDYQLFDLRGKLLKHGIVKNNTMYIDHDGLSILKLKIDKSWVVKKIMTVK